MLLHVQALQEIVDYMSIYLLDTPKNSEWEFKLLFCRIMKGFWKLMSSHGLLVLWTELQLEDQLHLHWFCTTFHQSFLKMMLMLSYHWGISLQSPSLETILVSDNMRYASYLETTELCHVCDKLVLYMHNYPHTFSMYFSLPCMWC